MPFDTEFWTSLVGEVVAGVAEWLPRLIGALLLLFLGWLFGRLVQFLLAGILRRTGMDRLAERAGIADGLAEIGVRRSLSDLFARLVYWLVLFVFVIAATESLGFSGVVVTLEGLVAYLPRVLAAALILLLGTLIARLSGDAVAALAVQAGVASGQIVGKAAQYVLLAFAVILALEQLRIDTTLLTTVATALIAATALALALAFGIGSRELARNIMAGFHAKDTFRLGQRLAVRDFSGRLLKIGTVKTEIETENGVVSLPNFVLTEEAVVVAPESAEKDGR